MSTLRAVRTAVPALAGLALAGIWGALAVWQPTTSWHLAPLLVGLTPPWTAAHRDEPHRGWVVIGGAMALPTAGMLHALDLLRGPALVGPDATSVALMVTAVGVLAGLVARQPRDGSGLSA